MPSAHSRLTRRPTVLRRTRPSHKGAAVAAPDTKKRRAPSRAPATNRRAADGATVEIKKKDLQELLDALRSARDGETGVRLSGEKSGVMGDVAKAFNGLSE